MSSEYAMGIEIVEDPKPEYNAYNLIETTVSQMSSNQVYDIVSPNATETRIIHPFRRFRIISWLARKLRKIRRKDDGSKSIKTALPDDASKSIKTALPDDAVQSIDTLSTVLLDPRTLMMETRNSILIEAYVEKVQLTRCSHHSSADFERVQHCQDCRNLLQKVVVDDNHNDLTEATNQALTANTIDIESQDIYDHLPVQASPSGVREGWSLTQELCKLLSRSWYWGPMSLSQAEETVRDKPDGTFLVRDSTNEMYFFSIVLRYSGRTVHTRIAYEKGQFSLFGEWGSSVDHCFPSVVDLIENYLLDCKPCSICDLGSQPCLRFPLKTPLPRTTSVQSLQHLCRLVILVHSRSSQIQELPLTKCMKDFLAEKLYS